MKEIICTVKQRGVYDSQSIIPSGNPNESPFKWSAGLVTYTLTNETGDIPDKHMQHIALNLAFEQWSLYIKDIKFKRVYGGAPADIQVSFSKSDPYFTSPGIMAYTYYPNPQRSTVISVFNDDPKLIWSLDGNGLNAHTVDPVHYPDPNTTTQIATYNLIQTFTHEMGHGLGLVHIDDCPACIMYPYYHRDDILNDRDIQAIQSLYGVKTSSQRLITAVKNILLRILTLGRYS